MNDETTPVDPDEEVAIRAFLHSEPLPAVDQVTRRRIVRTAMADARPAATPGVSRRVLTAAAAAAIAAVVVAGVLVSRDGEEKEPRLADLDRESVATTWAGDLGPARRDEAADALLRPDVAPLDANAPMPDDVVRCATETAGGRELVVSFAVRLEPDGASAFAFRYDEPGPDAGLVVAASDCRLLDRFDVLDAPG